VRRYNAQIEDVRAFLEGIGRNDPIHEFLDIDRIRGWASVKVGEKEKYSQNEKIAREYLPQAVYLIYFMKKLPEFRT
jgi:hypothetical protein